MVTGKTLKDWGFKPGKWFADGITAASDMRHAGYSDESIIAALQTMVPVEIAMRTDLMAGEWDRDAPWKQKRAAETKEV